MANTLLLLLSGPKDKTFHVKVTPWPVATTGQEVKVTLTFTPRESTLQLDVFYFSDR